MDSNIAGRRMQEMLTNFIDSGYYKGLCKAHKAMFDEYVKNGFTCEDALTLTIKFWYGQTDNK